MTAATNDTRGDAAPVIAVERLTKVFRSPFSRREVCAVGDVSLTVERGTVVAFVGPNGAGKTTTIHALLGLVHPDGGRVSLFGEPAGSIAARRRIGFQSEIFFTYGFRTAERVLAFYGALSEMSPAAIAEAVPRQLARLGLAPAANRKVQGFSKGMVQRLGLAQALLHQPELLILDEPTTGLDPEGRKLVADIILEEKNRGTTVFLSSHILSDVERTCDHVIILSKGRVTFSERMDRLRGEAGDWEIEVLEWSEAAREAVQGADVRAGGPTAVAVVRCGTAEKNGLLLALINAGATLGVVRRGQALEDLYMRYAGGSSSG